MNRIHLGSLVTVALLLLSLAPSTCATTGAASTSKSEATDTSVRPTCLPPFWAGLLAGSSTDREVKALLGEGYPTERHGQTVRLYTDPKRSATLVVELGTDSIVTSVDIWQGLEAGIPPHALPRMVSSWLRPSDGIGVWGGVHLGANQETVLKNMGTPLSVASENKLTVWVYESLCACELSTGLAFRFEGDRLISFGVWALNG